MRARENTFTRRQLGAALAGGLGSAVLLPPHAQAGEVAGPRAAERTSDPLALSQVERRLLNVALPVELLAQLAIWDERSRDFRKPQRGEILGGSAPLFILHLWADWCAPCRAEFPLLRELEAQLNRDHENRIKLCCLAQIPHGEGMYAFIKEHRDRMPRGPHYQDSGERIDRLLRVRFASETLPLPLTLIVDRDESPRVARCVVRYVLAGSLRGRTRELWQALDSLSALRAPPSPN